MDKGKLTKRFYTPKEAAEFFGFAEGTLANLRSKRLGCKFYKRGRKVLYDREEFDMWVRQTPVLTIDSLPEVQR